MTRQDKQTTELTMELRRVKQLEVEAQKLLPPGPTADEVESAVSQPDRQAYPARHVRPTS